MTDRTRLPLPARWLLHLSRVPHDTRAEVQADLLELFQARRRERGEIHAHWRLSHDVASLWLYRRQVTGPAAPRPTLALLTDTRGDIRYAMRLFARQPAILVLTIVGLSLGLGIATAAFSMMNAAVLRGEGVVDPDRAPAILRSTDRSVATAWVSDEFLQLREGSTRMQVEAVLTEAPGGAWQHRKSMRKCATWRSSAAVSSPRLVEGCSRVVRSNVPTSRSKRGSAPPVVVSYVFWTSTLHRDPNAVGRTIRIGRTERDDCRRRRTRILRPQQPLALDAADRVRRGV